MTTVADVDSPLGQRFWSKVDARGVCWEWVASKVGNGYGHFYLDGRHPLAHGVAYAALVGPVPEGLELDHLCRNRACVNPDHLEPVTRRENVLRGEVCSRPRDATCRFGHPRVRGEACHACQSRRSNAFKARERQRLAELGLTSRGTTPKRKVSA